MQNNEKPVFAADLLKPIETKRASELIFEQIQELITSGQMKPGERLPSERDMMEMLGKSRPTIREALRMLENAGLVRIVAGSGGAVVQTLTTSSVVQPLTNMLALNQITKEELLEYRRLNDVTFAGWAAERRTEADLKAMEENLESLSTSLDDIDAFIVCDIAFHELITTAGKNCFAQIVTGVISSSIKRILYTYFTGVQAEEGRLKREKALKAHSKIYRAILKGNAEDARSATIEHMRGLETDINVNKF